MGFWSLRNEHVKMTIILGPLMIPYFIQLYAPQYLYYGIVIGLVPIFSLIFVPTASAYIIGRAFQHLQMLMCEWPSGSSLTEDLLIDTYDPAGKMPAVFASNIGYWCTGCKAWFKKEKLLPNSLCPVCKNILQPRDMPVKYGGRWWWIYLVKAHGRGIRVPGYEGHLDLHGFVLPYPWEKFFHFGRRENGAFVYEELIDHPASDIFVSAIAPDPITYLGMEIPVHMGLFATGQPYKDITRSWTRAKNELNRLVVNMPKIIDDYKELIFPQKEVQELVRMRAEEPDKLAQLLLVKK